jgi:hypothetical protein
MTERANFGRSLIKKRKAANREWEGEEKWSVEKKMMVNI